MKFFGELGRKEFRILGGFFVALLALFVFRWWVISGSDSSSPREARTLPVEAEQAKIGSVTHRRTFSGVLVAHQMVVLKAEVEGKIRDILFKQGQDVKENEALLRIDEEVYRLRVREAQAALDLAKTEYDRAAYLFKKDFGAAAVKDQKFATLKIKEADLEAAKLNLSQTEIRAPFDGTVGLKSVSVGSFVTKNEELLTIVDLDPIYVDFPVSESYGKSLLVGQEIDAVIEGVSDLPVIGSIVALDPKADALTHSIQVRAELANESGALKPGQFARVTLELGRERGVLIPDAAVLRESNQDYVYRVVDGLAVRTGVTLGQKEGGMVRVVEGVKENDWVVTVGQIRIQDGYAVRIKNQPGWEAEPRASRDGPRAELLFCPLLMRNSRC